jgi:ABC-type branched-subunit amino acid transport system substrate-binding protein
VLSLGITLHFQSSYKVGDLLGLTTLATTLAKKEVDAIIFPGKIGDAITFFGSLQGAGVTKSPRPLGFAHWEDERSLKNSPLPLAGGIFTSPFSKFSNQDFINAYTVKFGKAPDFLAAQSFDALMLTLSSMKLVLDKDEPSFGAALRSITEYRGVTGVLRPQSNGEIERSYKLLTINEGRLSEIPE